jgi:serine/threonine protein kinase
MGAVYEAIDERLDTTVALKETLFTDERLRKQFEREARLLARMHHPALPRVSDHFSEGEGQFLVMQYIAGDDLAEMMKGKRGPFPVDQVLTWGDQLLDALDYLHTQDPHIIHRDIKPQNLKLTSRGQIILLDFGLAKGQTAGLSVVTTASIFGYTPNYAPLEQIQGLGTDARSDIYALSATLYHLMTGVKPPDALTRAAALVNGQPDPLAPATQVNSAVSPQVANVLARAMSQNRDQRYPTAADMRAALKGTDVASTIVERTEAATVIFPEPTVSRVEPPPAGRISVPLAGETTVVQPSRSRLAPWAIGVAALVLIVVGFGVFYAIQSRDTSTAVTTPSPEAAASPESSPAVDNVDLEATGGQILKEEAKALERQAEATLNKGVKAINDAAKIKDKALANPLPKPSPPTSSDYPNTYNTPVVPNAPQVNPIDNSTGPRRRQLGGPTIRNLPDGSQIIVNPDGSRVLVSPDGRRRVLRPGERIFRRRG